MFPRPPIKLFCLGTAAFLLLSGFSELTLGERSIAPPSSWQAPDNSTVLQYRVLKIIENAQRRHIPTANEPIFAPTCVHAPTISDFFNLSDVQASSSRETATATPQPDLNRPATNVNDVFNVIRMSRWGNAVMNKFYPKFGYGIRIDQFTAEMKAAEQKNGRRAAAVYDADAKTIYVNKAERIGTVAPILLHEIVHSLDGDFARSVEREREMWKEFDREVNNILKASAARTSKEPDSLQETDFLTEELAKMRNLKTAVEQFRDVRVYRAERVAYDMYYNVLKDLSDLFPRYYRTGSAARQNIRPYDDKELIRIEGLSPDTIDRYKRGLCKTKL